jgi:prepilin-type processing-associated H-X9-DG protein
MSSSSIQLRRIKAPDQSIMFWEAMEQYYQGQVNTTSTWNDCASWAWEEVLAARHYKGANVSCFDGHVEWWDQNTWTYWVNQTKFSRLWCYPLTAAGR